MLCWSLLCELSSNVAALRPSSHLRKRTSNMWTSAGEEAREEQDLIAARMSHFNRP